MAKTKDAEPKTEEELKAEETLRKAKAEKKAKKEAAADEAAAAAAKAIPTTVGGEVEYRKAKDLKVWPENPRTVTADPYVDSILADSMADGWDPRFPAVIFPDGQVIQGNRRLTIVTPDTMVPCTQYNGDKAGAMLIALNDTGTGIQEKGLGDVTKTVVNLMIALGLSAHTVVKYLWTRSRETLFRLSPSAKRAEDVEKAQKASRGKLQGLERYKKLPEGIREEIYEELNDGQRKAKVFPADVVKALLKADNEAAMRDIIDQRKADIVNAEDTPAGPPNKLTVKLFTEQKHVFKSNAFKTLVGLFEAPAEDNTDRDVLADLRELDASL